jgi:uncharacterized repeat protein (TIGR03987 family)
MPPLVRTAVSLMFLAFALYTVGVWSAFFSRRLHAWHALLFWLGFSADTAGTELMRQMAGGFRWGFHTATGGLALLLMLLHAVWATIVLVRGNESQLVTFHRTSLIVWLIWLIPFVTGLVLGAR